eukprot:TRINITY_DN20963_c0_g1_i1.p1 TRINITY_DN20963_c0_g1~~TRINITY_DN20963_c0_g1_i1.p1  ORF type:complete len:163 (+),score=48.27 TRINITY_DN20963_c0_g1_i1:92-580(+)
MTHNRHVNFDEDELAAYDLTRGKRCEIDQPDTPFLYYDSDGSEFAEMVKEDGLCEKKSVNLQDLQEKLELVSHLQESEKLFEASKKDDENPLFVKKRESWMRQQAEILRKALSERSLEDGADDDDDEVGCPLPPELYQHLVDSDESDSCEEYDESTHPTPVL